MKPQRIQLKRARGWTIPPNTKIVDRRTKFGNPFLVRKSDSGLWLVFLCLKPGGAPLRVAGPGDKAAAMATAVERYEHRLLAGNLLSYPRTRDGIESAAPEGVTVATVVRELRGFNLACWCPLDQEHCHAEVLLRIANDDTLHSKGREPR